MPNSTFSYQAKLESKFLTTKAGVTSYIKFSLVPELKSKIKEKFTEFLLQNKLYQINPKTKKTDSDSFFNPKFSIVMSILTDADHLFELIKNTYDKLRSRGVEPVMISLSFNVDLKENQLIVSLTDQGGGFGKLVEGQSIDYTNYHHLHKKSEKAENIELTGGANLGLRQINEKLRKVRGKLIVGTVRTKEEDQDSDSQSDKLGAQLILVATIDRAQKPLIQHQSLSMPIEKNSPLKTESGKLDSVSQLSISISKTRSAKPVPRLPTIFSNLSSPDSLSSMAETPEKSSGMTLFARRMQNRQKSPDSGQLSQVTAPFNTP